MNKLTILNNELERLHKQLENTPLFAYNNVLNLIKITIESIAKEKENEHLCIRQMSD